MDEKPSKELGHHQHNRPALTPLGVPSGQHSDQRHPDVIAAAPEMAVAEGDVRFVEEDAFICGSSLWRDAWRRLLKNKLAVFGLVVVVVVLVSSIIGPTLIKMTFGFTPD